MSFARGWLSALALATACQGLVVGSGEAPDGSRRSPQADGGAPGAGIPDAAAPDASSAGGSASDAATPDAGLRCVPACGGAPCGPDGCGGSCGTCPNNEACSNGSCIAGTCQPSCLAKDCGSDGCGGSCGSCNTDWTCGSAGLCVWNGTPSGVQVSWGQPCWWVCPPNPSPADQCQAGQRFQAIPFQLTTSSPIPLEATLYEGAVCDPGAGLADNLNDTGGTFGTGGWLSWFIHHPDMSPSSAVWWLGSSTTGCLDYTNAPDCQ